MAEHQIDISRVMTKVQEDPTGKLLVQNAVASCIIEDQADTIKKLQEELIEKSTSA